MKVVERIKEPIYEEMELLKKVQDLHVFQGRFTQ